MNRNKLKTYAPKARRDFIAAVSARAIKFGVSKDKIEPVQVQGNVALISGQAHPKKVAEQRAKLETRIKTRGFEQVMEEAAYTWFNRFAAIRYMEVHGYLDHGYRVLSHPEDKPIPEIVEHAQHLDLPGLDMEQVIELKLDGTKEGELYRMLLLAQCNALHAAMPFLFERINDETELLLPDNLLHSDSVIRQLVNEIDEADWQEIEIIGWLYQFYISEKKDQVIGKVVKSEDIPAATQLFTPNWIVKYMVQNTLGAKWLATYPQSGIRAKMEYYIEPAEQTEDVKAQLAEITPKELNPEEITFLDPACGSGHILVEAYDLFKDIYLERGYVLRDVPSLILEKNLFGLDIDDRAAQMAGFALLMKARSDDRRIFEKQPHLHIGSILDTTGLSPLLGSFASNDFMPIFEGASVYGSLVKVDSTVPLPKAEAGIATLFSQDLELVSRLAFQAEILARRYDCVAANPPYMGAKGMCQQLKEFVSDKYANGRADLFACFMERCHDFLKENGRMSMVTIQNWMFLSGYEALRNDFLQKTTLISLVQIGYNSFPTMNSKVAVAAAFTMMRRREQGYTGTYVDLNSAPQSADKQSIFLKRDGQITFALSQRDFFKIPGAPIAYWLPKEILAIFSPDAKTLAEVAEPKSGLTTGDNGLFLRMWWEVAHPTLLIFASNAQEARDSDKKWFPYNKGGECRKWYGNNELVINWYSDGRDIKLHGKCVLRSRDSYMKEGITWGGLTSSYNSFRWSPAGALFDSNKGPMCFPGEDVEYVLAVLNSNFSRKVLNAFNPSLSLQNGDIAKLPFPSSALRRTEISSLARRLIDLAKYEWDSAENSWGFSRHVVIDMDGNLLSDSVRACIDNTQKNIERAVEMEERINHLINESYGLPAALVSARVSVEDVSISPISSESLVVGVLSYAVGCMMGRFSLGAKGLVYANTSGAGFDQTQYPTFPADDDGIVPIMQADWFDDDAANRVVEFLKVAWSPETLSANLKFVADALGPKGNETPIETIRRYLSTDFFKDHLKTYKKRPIYWLFSSGKEKAFEALVYLHRYNEGTLSRMRMEYVTPLQGRISSRIDQLGRDIEAAASTAAQNKLRKEQEKLKMQQAELIKFDEELRHRADMRINLDLDDGVKVNYGKFGNLLAEVKAITGGSDE